MKSGDDAKFANEMGDLLLQVVFIRKLPRRKGDFTVADVIREVHEKMVRRHPHVFGEKRAKMRRKCLRNGSRSRPKNGRRRGAEAREIEKKEQRESLLTACRALPATMGRFAIDAEGFAGWI